MNNKVKKGWVAVRVGLEEEKFERFTIPISYLYHPLFKTLLEEAHEVYGYNTTGPLKLPCSVHDFHHIQRQIEKELQLQLPHNYNHHNIYHHHYYHLPAVLSFRSC
ncbi:hypothetical protein BUALT_Bualt04G0059200 [Buddleja alternifolia]|uniref:Small auxin up regulated protein n=1 Tax=Buddleja alternifolia TaxID=168488 RepID=A0AAV6XLN5_9LAMI|nr:hypothetical protein BUALT_Bualt04G0059200 [Buddleja alternifolia]